jgi:hypothetical protein
MKIELAKEKFTNITPCPHPTKTEDNDVFMNVNDNSQK